MREIIIETLSDADSVLFTEPDLNSKAFVSLEDVEMHLPMAIRHYSDSFGSLIHAENVSMVQETVIFAQEY